METKDASWNHGKQPRDAVWTRQLHRYIELRHRLMIEPEGRRFRADQPDVYAAYCEAVEDAIARLHRNSRPDDE